MIPSTIETWASSAAPGTRRYRVHSASGRTVLYCQTFDGLGQQYATYPSTTAACRAIDSDDIAWRLDLRHASKRRDAVAVAQ